MPNVAYDDLSSLAVGEVFPVLADRASQHITAHGILAKRTSNAGIAHVPQLDRTLITRLANGQRGSIPAEAERCRECIQFVANGQ